MSSFPSGLFGNVLKNSELSQESLSRAAPQSRIHQAGVKAQFYDTYLQKLEETGNEKTALDEAQGIVDALEFEFQEKSQEIQHEARIMKTEDQGASKERDVGKQMENDNEDFFEDQSVKSDVPDGQTAMHKFSKLQSAMSRLSTMRKMFDKPQDPPEFSRIRVAHRQLLLAVNSYDDIMESAIQDKEAAIQRESAQKIRDTEVNLKRKLEFEYGSKIDHNNCNVHINSLTKELAVIKEELVKTTTSYSRQQTELQDLRIFKSNAEAEAKLLVNELAKRRAQCSVLRKRLAAINATVTVEQKVNAMKADETGLSCSEHQYNSDANKTGGGDTTEAGEGNDSSMDEQVSEYYANNGTKRPKWNPSTIAGSRTAEHFDAVSTKCHENYSEPKSFQGISTISYGYKHSVDQSFYP